jgi:hypothetical protein
MRAPMRGKPSALKSWTLGEKGSRAASQGFTVCESLDATWTSWLVKAARTCAATISRTALSLTGREVMTA